MSPSSRYPGFQLYWFLKSILTLQYYFSFVTYLVRHVLLHNSIHDRVFMSMLGLGFFLIFVHTFCISQYFLSSKCIIGYIVAFRFYFIRLMDIFNDTLHRVHCTSHILYITSLNGANGLQRVYNHQCLKLKILSLSFCDSFCYSFLLFFLIKKEWKCAFTPDSEKYINGFRFAVAWLELKSFLVSVLNRWINIFV